MEIKKNKNQKKAHLMGICGSAMSSLAIILKEKGWKVSGTDEDFFGYSPLALKRNKIKFFKKFNPKNIQSKTDLVVLGNLGILSAETNPETKQAVKMNIKIQSMPETLAEIAKYKEQTVVAGSFGKSSCASMLAWCLDFAKKDPSYFFAAQPIDLKNSGHMGSGPDFVIEGDEYSSSKTDLRSKFLHFNPQSVLLISGEHDHVNLFPTETSYKATYKKLMKKLPKNGLLVYARDGKNNLEISKSAKCKKISYGLDKTADWYTQNIKYSMESSFDLMHKGKKIIHIKTKLLGRHNIENIVGAGALLLETKKISPKIFARAIKNFHGVRNRIELKTKNFAIPAYQGFGSSYEKTRAIFDTMKLHFPNKRLVTFFEPYAFSWRNRNFIKWYETVFNGVDEVIMLPAQGHGKMAKDQLTNTEVWQEVKKWWPNTHFIKNEKEGLSLARKILQKGDVVAMVSSGTLLELSESLPKLIDRKFKK